MSARVANGVILFIHGADGVAPALVDAVAGLAPLVVLGLDESRPMPCNVQAILVDIDLTVRGAVRRLRQLLSLWGAGSRPPLLCLLRDSIHHATVQARMLGAAILLPPHHPERVTEALLAHLDPALPPARMQTIARTAGAAAEARRHFADMLQTVAMQGLLAPDALAAGADMVLDAVAQTGVSTWLDVVRAYDDVTYQHCMLVAGLAAGFAEALGFRREDRQRLTRAALLHDVGKAFIPIEILNKPGRLTAEEMQVMQLHPAAGHEMLVRQGGFDPTMLAVVRHHHEYLDGSGYPDGLSGAEIPDLVRLVTTCDIYAALSERRPYKTERPPERCMEIMRGMAGKLDQDLLRAFAPMALRLKPPAAAGPEGMHDALQAAAAERAHLLEA